MSLERTMNDLEEHIDYASSFFGDLRHKIEIELTDLNEEIAQLKDEISVLEEQNILLTEQLEDSKYENGMINLELAEVTGQLIHMRYELDISRKGV
jgi:predicted  nucleic acid-binding Zn-ribbon protein